MFGKKKRENLTKEQIEQLNPPTSVASAAIGSGDVVEPGKIQARPAAQPTLTKREAEILDLANEFHEDYGRLISASDVANMSQVSRDAYLLNLIIGLSLEIKQLRAVIERMEDGDRI